MIKKTLYFGNPIYLSLRNSQLVLKTPDADKLEESFKQNAERTIPIEDIGQQAHYHHYRGDGGIAWQ